MKTTKPQAKAPCLDWSDDDVVGLTEVPALGPTEDKVEYLRDQAGYYRSLDHPFADLAAHALEQAALKVAGRRRLFRHAKPPV